MKIIKVWTAHCQTCTWSSPRSQEEHPTRKEKADHLKTHPKHVVRIFVSGQ